MTLQQPNGEKNMVRGIAIGAVAVVAIVVAVIVALSFVGDKSGKTDETPVATASQSAETAPAATEAAAGETAGEGEPRETFAGEYNGTPVRPGNPVIAKVDGEPITRVDVYNFIQLMPEQIQQMPATSVYPLALEQVINTRLIQNKAEAANMEETPEFKREVEIAKQQIVRNLFAQKAVEDKISDADLKSEYKKLVTDVPSVEERQASHILVESKEKAEALIKQIADGANFNELAKKESKDPTAAQNAGELGWFTKDAMVPEFAKAAYAMKKGDISKEPVKTNFGWHVIKLEDIRTQPKPSFEQVKPALEMQKRREVLEKLVNDWRQAAKIEVFDINGDPLPEGKAEAPAPETVAPAAAPDAAPAETPATEPAPAQ